MAKAVTKIDRRTDRYTTLALRHEVCQYYQTHTGQQTTAKFGIQTCTICKWRKKYGYPNKHYGYNLGGSPMPDGLVVKSLDLANRKFNAETGELRGIIADRDQKIESLKIKLERICNVALQVNM